MSTGSSAARCPPHHAIPLAPRACQKTSSGRHKVPEDVVDVFVTDRQPHHVQPDAGGLLEISKPMLGRHHRFMPTMPSYTLF